MPKRKRLSASQKAQTAAENGVHANQIHKWKKQAVEDFVQLFEDDRKAVTSPKYLDRLLREGIKISMDGRGRAGDNIFTERLWRTIKYEEVYLHEYTSPKEAYRQLAEYIRFCNFQLTRFQL